MNDNRQELLKQTVRNIVRLCHINDGNKLFGLRVDRGAVGLATGARVGAIELQCGKDAGAVLKALGANDCSLARQVIAWDFEGKPSVYMSGRCVRIEAMWDSDNAITQVNLSQLAKHPHTDGAFTVGMIGSGSTHVMRLDDDMANIAIIGMPGCGKSVLLASIAGQIAEQVDLAIIDLKASVEFLPVAHQLPLVAPVALDVEAARRVLAWANGEMGKRYKDIAQRKTPDDFAKFKQQRRIVVLIDEISRLKEDQDSIKNLIELVERGREARVHIVASTQYAVKESFGDTRVLQGMVGRLVGHVSNAQAGYFATGVTKDAGQPSAADLGMKGDFLAVSPGDRMRRIQVAYPDFGKLPGPSYQMDVWPDPEDTEPEAQAVNVRDYEPRLLAAALYVARFGTGRKGRSQLAEYCTENKVELPGDYAVQSSLMKWAKEVVGAIDDVCLFEPSPIPVTEWPTNYERT